MMKLCLEAQVSSEVRVYLCIILHRVSITVLHFTASRDWETVKMLSQETVNQNRINLTAREKVLNSHQMLNYSDISFIYFIYLFFIYLIIYLFKIVDIVMQQTRVNVI